MLGLLVQLVTAEDFLGELLCGFPEDTYTDVVQHGVMVTFTFFLKYELSLCSYLYSPIWWATTIFPLSLLPKYRLSRCLTVSRPTDWQEASGRHLVQLIMSSGSLRLYFYFLVTLFMNINGSLHISKLF